MRSEWPSGHKNVPWALFKRLSTGRFRANDDTERLPVSTSNHLPRLGGDGHPVDNLAFPIGFFEHLKLGLSMSSFEMAQTQNSLPCERTPIGATIHKLFPQKRERHLEPIQTSFSEGRSSSYLDRPLCFWRSDILPEPPFLSS